MNMLRPHVPMEGMIMTLHNMSPKTIQAVLNALIVLIINFHNMHTFALYIMSWS